MIPRKLINNCGREFEWVMIAIVAAWLRNGERIIMLLLAVDINAWNGSNDRIFITPCVRCSQTSCSRAISILRMPFNTEYSSWITAPNVNVALGMKLTPSNIVCGRASACSIYFAFCLIAFWATYKYMPCDSDSRKWTEKNKISNKEILLFGKNVCLYVIKFRYKLHWKYLCQIVLCSVRRHKISASERVWLNIWNNEFTKRHRIRPRSNSHKHTHAYDYLLFNCHVDIMVPHI